MTISSIRKRGRDHVVRILCKEVVALPQALVSRKMERGREGARKGCLLQRMLASGGVAPHSAACVLKGLRHERRRVDGEPVLRHGWVWRAEEPTPAKPRLLLVRLLKEQPWCFQMESGAWRSQYFLS